MPKSAPVKQRASIRTGVRNRGEAVTCARRPMRILSPLRYPGAKRRLARYISQAIALAGRRPSLFVEPFAGGASVSLQLLADDAVDRIGLVDRDELVAAFWRVAFFDTEWLCHQVDSIEVSLARWKQFKRGAFRSERQRALACLFLNRTSFSGILAPSGGPIGGIRQSGAYRLDCRFPRETLIKRLQQLAALRSRVAFVWNVSWKRALVTLETAERWSGEDRFYYFDPPFFDKADRLYTHYFIDRDHRQLRDALLSLKSPWVLSYDSIGKVQELYAGSDCESHQIELLYSASQKGGLSIVREALLTNLNRIPAEGRLWRRSREWADSRRGRSASHERGPSRSILDVA